MTLTLYMSPHCLSPHPSPSLSLNVFVAFFLLSNNSPSGPFSLYLSIHSLHICLFHPFWVQMLSKSLTAWVWHQLPLRSMRLTSDLGGGDEYVCMCCFESFHHAHYTFHHSSASFYSETKSAFNCMFALHIKASLVVVSIFLGGGVTRLGPFQRFFKLHVGWMNMQSCFCDEHRRIFQVLNLDLILQACGSFTVFHSKNATTSNRNITLFLKRELQLNGLEVDSSQVWGQVLQKAPFRSAPVCYASSRRWLHELKGPAGDVWI